MKQITVYFLLLLLSITGCKNSQSKKYGSVNLEGDDPVILAFKDTAQKKIKIFMDSLDKYGKDRQNYTFLVKSDFVQGQEHEHMWSRVYERNNAVFRGVFVDSAYKLKNIKTGDIVTVNQDAIDDWSIYNRVTHKTIGEFSMKYLETKMKSNK